MSKSTAHRAERAPSASRAIGLAIATSAAAAAASWLLPDAIAGACVGGVFLLATWLLVLRDRDVDARAWGLSMGGALDSPPPPWSTTLRAAAVAIGWAALTAIVFFPPFAVGFARFWHVQHLVWAPPPKAFDVALSQLVVIALPEEAFFRGYLQTALDRAWPPKVRVLGATVGPALLLTSALFALGHLATVPAPARLAVFFPSLVFGWLRARTGGIGAGIAFHAACNLLSDGLARGAHFI